MEAVKLGLNCPDDGCVEMVLEVLGTLCEVRLYDNVLCKDQISFLLFSSASQLENLFFSAFTRPFSYLPVEN